jgi:hypothetical protein
MNVLLRIANGQDCCVTLLLACLLAYSGGFLIQGRPSVYRAGWALCVAASAADFVYLCYRGDVANVPQLFGAVVAAMINGYLACGVGWILFASLAEFFETVVAPIERRIREKLEADRESARQAAESLAEAARKAEAARVEAEERERAREAERERLRNVKPPPTKQEQMEAARAAFDEDVRLAALIPDEDEREAAEARARRRFNAARKRIGL